MLKSERPGAQAKIDWPEGGSMVNFPACLKRWKAEQWLRAVAHGEPVEPRTASNGSTRSVSGRTWRRTWLQG